jgi:hypothetical protein
MLVRSGLKFAKWSGITIASLFGLLAVSVLAAIGYQSWKQRTEKDCPLLGRWLPMSHTSIADSDSIEVSNWYGGPHSSYPNTVKVFGDGLVQRETTATSNVNGTIVVFGCPLREADKTAHISGESAKRLISLARDGGFCRLCGSYTHHGQVYDGGSTKITLTVSGKSHTVRVINGDPPRFLWSIQEGIDKVAPLGEIATPWKFSPDRRAECDAFEQEQNVKMETALHHERSGFHPLGR